MSFKIEHQECQVMPGGLLIRTRVPKEHITDAMIAACAAYTKLPAQDNLIIVQVTDHYGNELWHEAEYRMISCKEETRTEDVDSGRQTITRTALVVQVERKSDWWDSKLAPKVGLDALEGEAVEVLPDGRGIAPRRGRPAKAAA